MVKVEKPTVLVADDDTSCRDAVQEALETVGYLTVPASTGLEAVEMIRSGFSAARRSGSPSSS